jgi:hypothetical protein
MNKFLGLACAMLAFGSFAASASPPTILKESSVQRQRETWDNAYGRHCSYNESTAIWRCRGFDIYTASDRLTEPDGTSIMVGQEIYGPNRRAWRYVSCPVPDSALKLKLKKPPYAEVDVSFDSEGAGCESYGSSHTYDPGLDEWTHADWSYFGTVSVQAQLLAPQQEQNWEYTGKIADKDYSAGTSRENRVTCKGGFVYSIVGGGFTMYGDDILELYFPFDGIQTHGNFSYHKCSRMGK